MQLNAKISDENIYWIKTLKNIVENLPLHIYKMKPVLYICKGIE